MKRGKMKCEKCGNALTGPEAIAELAKSGPVNKGIVMEATGCTAESAHNALVYAASLGIVVRKERGVYVAVRRYGGQAANTK